MHALVRVRFEMPGLDGVVVRMVHSATHILLIGPLRGLYYSFHAVAICIGYVVSPSVLAVDGCRAVSVVNINAERSKGTNGWKLLSPMDATAGGWTIDFFKSGAIRQTRWHDGKASASKNRSMPAIIARQGR